MVKRYEDELHLLKTIKGQLNTAIRHQFTLMEAIGTISLPQEILDKESPDYKQLGEVLYDNVLGVAFCSKRIEEITNVIRARAGLKEMDYSETFPNQVIRQFKEHVEEMKAELKEKEAV